MEEARNFFQYGSTLDNFPNLEMARPIVNGRMQVEAEQHVPTPANCKPWLDAQKTGLVIVWPHEKTTVRFDAVYTSASVSERVKEEASTGPRMTVTPPSIYVGRFAPRHFSIQPQYIFRTAPGIGLYVTGLPDGYKSPLPQPAVVRGVLETDWYSPPPFFVFKIERMFSNAVYILDTGDPICMVVPVVLNPVVSKMSTPQTELQLDAANEYNIERANRDDIMWRSTDGQFFSHIYKEKSRHEHG